MIFILSCGVPSVRTTYEVLIVAMILMGLIMFVMPVPKDSRLRVYKRSLYLMAVSYIALGVYCIIKSYLPLELLGFPFLIAASVQVLLLGNAHLILVNPQKVNTKFVLKTAAPIFSCVLLFLVAECFCGDLTLDSYATMRSEIFDFCVLARVIWGIVYLAEVIFFIHVFYESYRGAEVKVNNYLAESPRKADAYVLYSHTCAVIIGTIALGSALTVSRFAVGLHNVIMLFLYMLMVFFFMRYLSLFYPAIEAVAPVDDSDDDLEMNHCGEATPEKWAVVKKMIEDEKLYLEPGLTVSSLADILKVNKVCLSKTINFQEGVNFGTFIGRMRIAEAQRLMREDRNRPISDIAMAVGFSEQSNFSRQFKAVTGFTPGDYRQSI